MLKVECESCKAPYQVDERRVPPTGLKMRCPKCGHTFLVTDPSKAGAAPAPGMAVPAPPPPKKATMMGLAPKPSGPSAGKVPNAPPAGPAPMASGPFDFDMGLPAVKASEPKLAFANKPTAPAMPAAAAPPVAPPPFPGLDDLDLPALAGDVGLPAAVTRPKVAAARPAPAPAPAPAPPPVAAAAPPPKAPAFDFDVDLPAVVPPPAPAPSGGFGSLDLPTTKPKGAPPPPQSWPDLPAAKPMGGPADLPLAKPGARPAPPPAAFADLPAPHQGAGLPMPARGAPVSGGFGEIDLPSVQNDLPMQGGGAGLPVSMGAGAHLPSPMGAGAHLPSPMGAGAHLPSPMGASAHLPSPSQGNLPSAMSPHAHLPSAMGAGAHLPSPMGLDAHMPNPMSPSAHLPNPMGANAHLPNPMGPGAHLPTAMGPGAHMPQPVSDDRLMPRGAGSPIAFGELDLPLVGPDGGAPPPPAPTSGNAFGEVDLAGSSASSPPLQAPPSNRSGGMGFGEVDLGGGSDASMPLGPPPAATGGGGSLAYSEASLDQKKDAPQSIRRRPRDLDRPPSKLPKILGIGVAALVIGGAALQLTSVGAFGHLWITDRMHQGDYLSDAAAKGDFARKKLALDTYVSARQAADDVFDARKKTPRSKPLGAYAAFVEYANQVRFGVDAARAGRVQAFLVDIPPNVGAETPYYASAQAAQAAQAGEWDKAKALLDAAIAKEPKDGIQHELSILKGEIALAQKDTAGALAAFNQAHASGGSARTFFGIARAQYNTKQLAKAREAVDSAIKGSPTHAGALTMRAQLLWEMQRDDVAAMKDLGVVLEEKNKKLLSIGELSNALAAKGWIMFQRDRAGEARLAFDEAVKVDPRNVSALIGQGEVLYADLRYTEALTRFDDAVSKDASNLLALIGSAKTKISLENLQGAKAQLVAARQKWPKEMLVALWLARVEDALGNRKVAEELMGSAVDLADPKSPDAIQAYASFAKFLASLGKPAEAAAKLEQAKAKLPDTPALHRAFGEVAAAQGNHNEAIEHFETALKMNPSDLGTRFALGQEYIRLHKLDLAAKALDEVSAIDKDYPNMALVRGQLFEESGDVNKALEQFNSALQKQPNDIDLKLRVGAAYVSIGEPEKALPLLKEVASARPNSAEAQHFMGRAYLKQGGLEQVQATRYLQKAVALDPNKAEYHLYVAWAANDATPPQLGTARTHIEKALSLDKLLADAYWQRGVLEHKEAQVKDALKDLRKALELKPSRHEAHATLAQVLAEQNDIPGAMAEWQKAIAGDERPPFWRYMYGKLLQDKNQNAEAAKHLAYAIEAGKKLQPRPQWLSQAGFEGGEAMKRTGQKKEACDAYHVFMELAQQSSPDRKDALRAMNELGCPWEGK